MSRLLSSLATISDPPSVQLFQMRHHNLKDQSIWTDLRIAFDKEVMIGRIIMQMLVVIPIKCLADSTGSGYPSRALHDQRILIIRHKPHDSLRLITPK